MSKSVDWCIKNAYLAATRKAAAPAVGTTKYNALLGLVDLMQKEWADTEGVEWNSLYTLVSNGTLSATDTFDLDDTIQYISKREGDYGLATNGTNTTTYQIVTPNQLYGYRDQAVVAQVGQTLKFSKAFTSTSGVFGYSFKIPAIVYPDDITSGTQEVQVDDPLWLVYKVAAEFVSADLVKNYLEPRLTAKADKIMMKMKQANTGQYEVVDTNWRPAGSDGWD